MVILHLMAKLLQMIFVIIIGSRPLYNENFAIVQGKITTPVEGDTTIATSILLNYPEGFNKDNCVIISLMSDYTGSTRDGYWTVGSTMKSAEAVRGNYGLQAGFWEDGISVSISKISTSEPSKTINVRIVLMKLPTGNDANLLGDVNLDDSFTTVDYDLILGFYNGNNGLNFEQYANADMNKDGQIKPYDATLWLQEHGTE